MQPAHANNPTRALPRRPLPAQSPPNPTPATPKQATTGSFTTPQSLVVASHAVRELRRHRVAIDRHHGIGRFAPSNLLADSPTQFVERLGNQILQLFPVGNLRMALKFGP